MLPAASVEVAFLDRAGVIESVNDAWLDFCVDNGGDLQRCGVGASYLTACLTDEGDLAADLVAGAIRSAVRGDLPAPIAVRVPCDGPGTPRWFDILISSRLSLEGECLGAVVTLSQRAAELGGPDTLPASGGSRTAGSRMVVGATMDRAPAWRGAALGLTRTVFAGGVAEPLTLAVRSVALAAEADWATLNLVATDGRLSMRAVSDAAGARGVEIELDREGSFAGGVLSGATTTTRERFGELLVVGEDRDAPIIAVGVPLFVGRRVIGALCVARTAPTEALYDIDPDDLAALAAHVSLLALELQYEQLARDAIVMLRQHDLVARKLHDRVVQEMFFAGMALEEIIGQLDQPAHQRRLMTAVDTIDGAIAQVREAALALRYPGSASNPTVPVASPAAPGSLGLALPEAFTLRLTAFTELFWTREDALDIPSGDRAELRADVATMEAALTSPLPRPSILIDLFTSVWFRLTTLSGPIAVELMKTLAG